VFRRKSKTSELDILAEKEKALMSEMQRLESYIQNGAAREHAELINTMPAPDELSERRRSAYFLDQVLSKKEIRNIKRNQAKGFVIFLLLGLAIVSLGSWILRAYNDHLQSSF
jgi:Cys-tRNA synthase (O-phospho-L-seryl-tRNA:Cys-tRNA synthase)